jgi:UMF1 family MFS transporter
MSDTASNQNGGAIADLAPLWRAKQQKAWYWYDWANSAYVTTVSTVLAAPYLISVAKEAAIDNRVNLLGLSVDPGSLPAFLVTLSTILSAVLLPPLGAYVDRVANKKGLLVLFAWIGAAFGSLFFFTRGDNWQLGAIALVGANLFLAASLVVNDSILPLISEEFERDRVSSRGWAWGYLGGGLLLVVNLAVVTILPFGLSLGSATRWSMLSACIWWAGFALIPFFRLNDIPPANTTPVEGGILKASFGQLAETFRDMKQYPVAVTFLLAYLFFNDGIQTVITQSSTYGTEQLKFSQTVLIGTILIVQFVAYGGALLFGRLAEKFGAKRTILSGIAVWMLIVTIAMMLPAKSPGPFYALAVAIGIVLGGTQALARSYFSLLIPKGKEAEYFSFYHAVDRGTSWFGALLFGVVHQVTGSFRPAIFALIILFVIGGGLLLKVDTAKGIRDAGNEMPPVV